MTTDEGKYSTPDGTMVTPAEGVAYFTAQLRASLHDGSLSPDQAEQTRSTLALFNANCDCGDCDDCDGTA